VKDRWCNGQTGGLEILVLNAALDAEAFIRTRDARISILARARPETGYVDADRSRHQENTLADGAGHTF